RLARGRAAFSTVSHDIPVNCLQRFAQSLLARLDRLGGQFHGAFFELEAKGVKGTSIHNPSDEERRRDALETVLDPLDITLIPDEELRTRWYVDVALEVHQPGHVMQWLTDAHPRLIRHALPHVNATRARELTRSKLYACDLSGHLTDLSGFRLEPRSYGTRDRVTYANVYTTDKNVTYQLNGGLFRRHTSVDLYPNKLDKLLQDIDAISTTFHDCAGGQGVLQDGAARFEVRVNIAYALFTHTTLPNDLIRHSVLPIPSRLWWSRSRFFKFYRATAIYSVLQDIATTPPEARAWISSLQLGSICMYMLNGVIYRPSELKIDVSLAKASALR
ncbi:hypothetical protein DICSQDRAFT_20297, partial [Dichomitus squalens LYAD-421 SS1]